MKEEKGKVSFLKIKFERKIEENNPLPKNQGKSPVKRRRGRKLVKSVDQKYQKSIKDFLTDSRKVEEDRPVGAKRKIEDDADFNFIGSPKTPKTRKLGEK